MAVAWSGVTVLTVRKFWPRMTFEGKFWAVFFNVIFAFGFPIATDFPPHTRYLLAVAYVLFIGLPFSVAGGYVFGIVMHALLGKSNGE